MPLVIPAALLLLLGASTLLSRTIRNHMASTRQSDAQLARDAAESGMNRVLSALNPLAKFSSDPYVSFLLASRWVEGTGVTYTTGVTSSTDQPRSGWRLTSLSRANVQNLLRSCGLSVHGQHPDQLPPDDGVGYRNILSGAIGPRNVSTDIQLRYLVTHYVPPARVASNLAWPTECDEFTSLSGGSGQISVEGRVIRNGRVLSTYTLTRSIDVQGWPLPQLPASWLNNGAFPGLPGPPVGLRIAGVASSLNRLSMRYYRNILDEAHCILGFCGQRVGLPQCLNNCLPNGQLFQDPTVTSVPMETRIVPILDVIPQNDSDLPRYPFDTNQPPTGLIPAQINESRANYPYTPSGDLYPECRYSDLPNSNRPREFRPNEIDCWVASIGSVLDVRAATVVYQASPLQVTVTLPAGSRFDIQPGSSYMIKNVPGWTGGNDITGVVTSASGSTFTLTPTSAPPGSPTPDCAAAQAPTSCLVSPLPNLDLHVNTAPRPVNLIVLGNIGADPGNPNPPITTPGGQVPTTYVTLKHAVGGTPLSAGGPYSHANSTSGTRALWNRLRIFGRMGTSAECANNPLLQAFYIRPNPGSNPGDASLGGVFLWLPRGALVYGSPNLAAATYPDSLLSVWWTCRLDVRGITNGFSPTLSSPVAGTMNTDRVMQFITPLFGNQDAVSSVLPGGFMTPSGAFTPDARFPVYPTLMRIRSAF
jgi:hypothetical protein